MNTYYAAVDLGASSGRLILGHMENGSLHLEEMRRFDNELIRQNGHWCWDYDMIFREIVAGLKDCGQQGKAPVSVSVDTWGVDFVLLDESGQVIGQTVGYRDERTEGMDLEVERIIPREKLYGRTGTLKAIYNTIYQLMALKKEALEKGGPDQLLMARTLLMVPDYFHYLLTGVKSCEYSEATTSGLIDPGTKDWDRELIRMLGLPDGIFLKPIMAGTAIGKLRPELADEIGYDLTVTACCSHDTQSAIMAVPAAGPKTGANPEEGILYISSGTWSLMGVERAEADCSAESAKLNFTNEGGFGGTICYLKNIMGLWMIQSVRREFGKRESWAQLCELAEKSKDFPSRVDAEDESFLNPESMTGAIRDYCRRTGQQVPRTLGQLATVIYESLALCYARTASLLEKQTGQTYRSIFIVGGGSNADYLNRLTAKASGRKVYAGPGEASATGNILSQMIASGAIADLEEGRKLVRDSFEIKKYDP